MIVDEKEAPWHHPTILVVDDDPDSLESIQSVLEKAVPGAIVLGAESADAARRLLGQQAIDLVVSDYLMPGQDGVAFLTEVRRQSHAACVLMTGHSELGLAHRARRSADINAFTIKPFDAAGFIRLVEQVLSHRDQFLYAPLP